MLRPSTILCVLTGAALLAGGIAVATPSLDRLGQSQAFLADVLPQKQVARKGDRLMGARAAENLEGVSIVEIVGLTHAAVILRGSNGEVLYRSDPRTGITTITKNTDLPILTLKEEVRSPPGQHLPTSRREGSDGPQKERRMVPIGCVGDLSTLVRAGANRIPNLCLASLKQSIS